MLNIRDVEDYSGQPVRLGVLYRLQSAIQLEGRVDVSCFGDCMFEGMEIPDKARFRLHTEVPLLIMPGNKPSAVLFQSLPARSEVVSGTFQALEKPVEEPSSLLREMARALAEFRRSAGGTADDDPLGILQDLVEDAEEEFALDTDSLVEEEEIAAPAPSETSSEGEDSSPSEEVVAGGEEDTAAPG